MLLPVVLVLTQNDHKGSDLNKAFNDHKGATTTTDVAFADHHAAGDDTPPLLPECPSTCNVHTRHLPFCKNCAMPNANKAPAGPKTKKTHCDHKGASCVPDPPPPPPSPRPSPPPPSPMLLRAPWRRPAFFDHDSPKSGVEPLR